MGGEHTGEGVGRLPSMLAIDKPGFVLILEGTNDAERVPGQRTSPPTTSGSMVQIAKATNGRSRSSGPFTPSFRNNPCADDVINEVNINIRGIAGAENIVIAEIFNGMNHR